MNKQLVLLCYALLISNSFCADCTANDACDYGNIDASVKDHYACVEENENCVLRLKCIHAVKGENDQTFKCSDYYVETEGKTCTENPDTESESVCIEEFKCTEVQRPAGETNWGDATFDCSPYPVTDKTASKCVKNEDETTSACKEEPLTCTTVPKSISSLIKCSDYEVSTDKSATHYCVEETDTSKDTACKEIHICTEAESDEGDCSQFPVESSKSSTHVCVKAEAAEGGEGASHCEEKYLCNKVPSGTSVECQNLVISEENLNTHHCVSTTESDPEDVNAYACKEEKYTCAELPKIKDTETNIKCSDFSVDSDKATTHVCVEDTTSEDKQCKQMKLCSAVENNDMTADITCSSDFYYDKETYVCQKNEETNLCEQIYLCNKVPSDATGTCSDYATSDANHLCIEGGSASKCKEEYICSSGQGETDKECSQYPVTKEKTLSHRCTLESKDEKKCKEKELCTKIPLGSPTDALCGEYLVDRNKIGTHICVKNTDETEGASSCMEQVLCDSVQKEGDGEVECSNYPVKTENKDTHICVKNTIGENPCKEEKLCEEDIEGTSDEECRKHPVATANSETKACIKNPVKDSMGCVEKELCTTVSKGEGVDCSIYPVSTGKENTHICKAVDTSDKCSEVLMSEIDCASAEKGEDDNQCKKYKVSDTNFECVKNTDTTTGAKPCMLKEKSAEPEPEITACKDKTSGATEDICSKLSVEKEGKEKCIKNPSGDNCMLLAYCQYGEGTSDAECAKFALEANTKICKKKASENKCEEVEKTSEEGDDTTESTDTDDTTEASEKDDTTKTTDKDDTTKETSKQDTTKETSKQDTTKETSKQDTTKEVVVSSDNVEGTDKTNTTTTKEKNNSGNFMNVGFGLLLLYTLL